MRSPSSLGPGSSQSGIRAWSGFCARSYSSDRARNTHGNRCCSLRRRGAKSLAGLGPIRGELRRCHPSLLLKPDSFSIAWRFCRNHWKGCWRNLSPCNAPHGGGDGCEESASVDGRLRYGSGRRQATAGRGRQAAARPGFVRAAPSSPITDPHSWRSRSALQFLIGRCIRPPLHRPTSVAHNTTGRTTSPSHRSMIFHDFRVSVHMFGWT